MTAAPSLAPANLQPVPIQGAPGQDHLDPGHPSLDAQRAHAGVDLARDHSVAETQSAGVAGNHLGHDHESRAPQGLAVVADPRGGRHPRLDAHGIRASAALLDLAAASLDDIERARIATASRLRAMRDDHGLASTLDYQRAELIHDALAAAEHQAELEVKRALRQHPLGAWVKRTVGIGEKQGARLLAALDDPYWNHAEDRPRRGPAELWAYCGYVPGQRRRRGERCNWNAEAKMRARLVAECAVQAGVRKLDGYDDSDGYDLTHREAITPLGAVYLRARAKHAEAVHDEPCPQCGPAGHPAPGGSPLSNGHQHARAPREVAKAILRDLYLAAKDVAS
jgi:hypothetical protein